MSNKIIKRRRRNYTTIDNAIFKDRNLSAKAKGILSQMFSLPDDWNYSIKGLSDLFSDGELSIKNGLDELKKRGYLKVNCVRDSKGRISDWMYIIKEDPTLDDTDVDLPELENRYVDNKGQLNTNILSTNKSNTNQCSCKNSFVNKDSTSSNSGKEKENIYETIVSPIFSKDSKKKRFEKPTFEEVEAYIREQDYDIDPHTFFDYYEACGWTVGKNKPMKDWKASVRYWVSSRKSNGDASKPAKEEHQFNVRQYFPGDEDKIPF